MAGPIESHSAYTGTIIDVRISRYRRADGTVVRREVLDHAGAVVVVPVEDDHVLLVRQPREAVERLTLELPAGKLEEGEDDPLECARRELAEEVGRAAGRWTPWGGFFTAPALITEYIHCFLAERLTPVEGAERDTRRGHRGGALAAVGSRRADRARGGRQDPGGAAASARAAARRRMIGRSVRRSK